MKNIFFFTSSIVYSVRQDVDQENEYSNTISAINADVKTAIVSIKVIYTGVCYALVCSSV